MDRIYSNADSVVVWMDINVDIAQPIFQKLLSLSAAGDIRALSKDPNFWLPLKEPFTSPW